MFIAHLPAGYLGGLALARRAGDALRRRVMLAFMLGSVLPDIDMLYFYLLDDGRTLHHHYWTHLPVFWLGVLAALLLGTWILRSRALGWIGGALVAGVFLHLTLDTPFGGVLWLYPLTDHSFCWYEVPATRSWWVWSFVLHWSFLTELAICAAAAALFARRRRLAARR